MITAQNEPTSEESFEIPLIWGSGESLPVLATNQVLLQVDAAAGQPDMVLLTFGHASPPPVSGTPEQQRERMAKISEVVVQPVVRLSLSPRRLKEVVDLLQRNLGHWDHAATEEAHDGDTDRVDRPD
jgi:hypothetical protein